MKAFLKKQSNIKSIIYITLHIYTYILRTYILVQQAYYYEYYY